MPRQKQQRGEATMDKKSTVDFVAEILGGCDGIEGGGCEHDDGTAAAGVPGETGFKSKNLETERRRRAKLKHQLFTLRSLVPRITKMSKEATLADAVDYIKELQRQKENLQKELQDMADEDVDKQGSASSTSAKVAPSEPVHCKVQEDVEVSPLGKSRLRARVVCRNKRGGFTKLVEAMSSLGLEVTDASFLTLDGVSQVTFCMEKAGGERLVAGDKVRDLLRRVI